MIWSVSHSIGEMAIMYPLPSAYVQWTSKFICPAAAFALGWVRSVVVVVVSSS